MYETHPVKAAMPNIITTLFGFTNSSKFNALNGPVDRSCAQPGFCILKTSLIPAFSTFCVLFDDDSPDGGPSDMLDEVQMLTRFVSLLKMSAGVSSGFHN